MNDPTLFCLVGLLVLVAMMCFASADIDDALRSIYTAGRPESKPPGKQGRR